MLGRGATERPQRVLHAASQRRVALAAEHHLGMLPGGIRQNEVIETVRQRLAGDTDAKLGHVGEVRQALLARRVVLTEYHLARSSVFGTPCADTALQGAAEPIPIARGMAPLHLVQHHHRPYAGTGDQHRQDVALPQAAERVGDLPPQGSLGTLLGRQPRIALNPAASALAEAGLGGSDTLGMVATELHIHSQLLIGGGASGHVGPRFGNRRPDTARTHAATRDHGNPCRPVWPTYDWAMPTLKPAKPAILRVADRPTLLSRERRWNDDVNLRMTISHSVVDSLTFISAVCYHRCDPAT